MQYKPCTDLWEPQRNEHHLHNYFLGGWSRIRALTYKFWNIHGSCWPTSKKLFVNIKAGPWTFKWVHDVTFGKLIATWSPNFWLIESFPHPSSIWTLTNISYGTLNPQQMYSGMTGHNISWRLRMDGMSGFDASILQKSISSILYSSSFKTL